MTRKEAERLARQAEVLRSLGFTSEEAEQLRRISMTLRRWHELECGVDNGCIERDEETGLPYWRRSDDPRGSLRAYRIPDREKGALKRLEKIIAERNRRVMLPELLGKAACLRTGPVRGVEAYIQTDPRGAALYIIRPGDVPAGEDAGAYYNLGICVY
jgi:hypothetical protein